MLVRLHVVCLVASLFGLIGEGEATCGHDAMQNCLGTLPTPLTSMTYKEIVELAKQDSDHMVHVITAVPHPGKIAQACSDFDSMKDCMENALRFGCDDLIRESYEGISASYQWLCSTEGRTQLAQYGPCLMTNEATSGIKTCLVDFHREVVNSSDSASMDNGLSMDLTFTEGDARENYESFCKLTSSLTDCMKDKVSSSCSDKAAKFWTTFVEQKRKFVDDQDGCDVAGQTMNVTAAIASGEYKLCNDGSMLVNSQTQWCDGIMECLDGSDELYCDYAKAEERRTTLIAAIVIASFVCIALGVTCYKMRQNNQFLASLRRKHNSTALVDMENQDGPGYTFDSEYGS